MDEKGNIAIIFLICFFLASAVIIGGAFYFKNYIPDKESRNIISNNTFSPSPIASSSSSLIKEETSDQIISRDIVSNSNQMMGAFRKDILFYDGSFIRVDTLNVKPGQSCRIGRIAQQDYDQFISFAQSSGILDARISQKSESGLICDGGSSLYLRIKGKESTMGSPCVDESKYTQETKKILELEKQVTLKLYETLDYALTTQCAVGIYVSVINMGDRCEKLLTKDKFGSQVPAYSTLKPTDLPTYIQHSIERGGYMFAGALNNDIKTWLYKYFEVGRICFKSYLYTFDGDKFDHVYN